VHGGHAVIFFGGCFAGASYASGTKQRDGGKDVQQSSRRWMGIGEAHARDVDPEGRALLTAKVSKQQNDFLELVFWAVLQRQREKIRRPFLYSLLKARTNRMQACVPDRGFLSDRNS
jgi:hypothetical protein